MKKDKKSAKKTVKSMVAKAGAALKNEFFLECSMIISAILELRLRTLIIRVEKANPGSGFNLEQCLKRIKYLHLAGKDTLLVSTLDVKLIDEMRRWKNQRNSILKDLADIHVSKGRQEKLARDGSDLLKQFTIVYKRYKKEC